MAPRDYCSREISRERGPAPTYAVAKASGRCQQGREGGARVFARLRGVGVRGAVRTSGVTRLELPASEPTASALGGTPVPGDHGPGLGARALSLPDTPGTSGCRHHFILVPGQQHPGLPASHVHPRGVREEGYPASGSSLCHPGPLCSGVGWFLLGSFHVQQHPESHFQAIGAHCSASVALSFFIFESWECTTYWYIFVFCSALPAVTEMALFVTVFGLKKKPL